MDVSATGLVSVMRDDDPDILEGLPLREASLLPALRQHFEAEGTGEVSLTADRKAVDQFFLV